MSGRSSAHGLDQGLGLECAIRVAAQLEDHAFHQHLRPARVELPDHVAERFKVLGR